MSYFWPVKVKITDIGLDWSPWVGKSSPGWQGVGVNMYSLNPRFGISPKDCFLGVGETHHLHFDTHLLHSLALHTPLSLQG